MFNKRFFCKHISNRCFTINKRKVLCSWKMVWVKINWFPIFPQKCPDCLSTKCAVIFAACYMLYTVINRFWLCKWRSCMCININTRINRFYKFPDKIISINIVTIKIFWYLFKNWTPGIIYFLTSSSEQ